MTAPTPNPPFNTPEGGSYHGASTGYIYEVGNIMLSISATHISIPLSTSPEPRAEPLAQDENFLNTLYIIAQEVDPGVSLHVQAAAVEPIEAAAAGASETPPPIIQPGGDIGNQIHDTHLL